MAKKVFISYAWEDEKFSQTILDFSNKLRANGIDANIDQYEENPDMGWPIWMEQQIDNSDFVLVVATKTINTKGIINIPKSMFTPKKGRIILLPMWGFIYTYIPAISAISACPIIFW